MPRTTDRATRVARDRLHGLASTARAAPAPGARRGAGGLPAAGLEAGPPDWVPPRPTGTGGWTGATGSTGATGAAAARGDAAAAWGDAAAAWGDAAAARGDAAAAWGDAAAVDRSWHQQDDRRDVTARLHAGAMATAAAAYAAEHGQPLEHLRSAPGRAPSRWQLSVRLAVVSGVAVAVLTAGVITRATLQAPATSELVTAPAPARSAPGDPAVSPRVGPATVGRPPPTGAVGRPPPTGAVGRPPPTGAGGIRSGLLSDGRVVVVHVVGQVRAPGVVQLPTGSRVSDALAAAGGPAPGADLASLNLARVVGDGEQVVVPAPGQVGGGAVTANPLAVGGKASVVDLNSADLAALDSLPGIGPVLAQRVLAWRAEHGRFTDVTELGEVPGIGDTLLGRLRDLVRV
jgi:competence protein ComEA